jgi:CHAT domain-containing protein/tetratricopeptide (TPR) repeat protein
MLRPIKHALTAYSTTRHSGNNGLSPTLALFILLLSTLTAYAQRPADTNGGAAGKGPDVRALEPGKPIEREMAGGETHVYQLTLAAGQYARVVVDQRRINVALSAFDSAGKKLAEDDMFGIGDSELVSLIAETPTTYRLEVRSPDKAAPTGRYEIKIKELRAATAQDQSAVAGERLVAEGVQLQAQFTADSLKQSVEKFQQSLPLWQSAKNPAWEATVLYLIGSSYTFLQDKQKAFDYANRALPVAEAAVQESGEEEHRLGLKVKAYALDILGNVYMEFDDQKKALALFTQALPLRRASGDRAGEASTLNLIGTASKYIGEWLNALDAFNQARVIVTELGNRAVEAKLLSNVCVIYIDLGEYKKAIDFCNQALVIRRELNDRLNEATALNNMGNAYSSLGDYQRALDLYMQTHAIYKERGTVRDQAITLNNIGFIYGTLGEDQKAIDYYNQALEIVRAAGDKYREGNVLGNIAVIYSHMEDYRKALETNLQVLSLRRAVNNHDGEAITLNNIAGCYSNLGDRQKALDYYNQSLALHRTLGNPRQLATALSNLGALYRDMGEHQKALDHLNEGLQISRAIGDRNNEAGLLAHLARVERDRGNLAAARSRIEEALAAVESLRINLKSYRLRASYFASVRKHHEFNIDLLMRLHKERPSEGFDAAALQASEKGRARSLLELLAEAGGEIRQGVDPSLLERERLLRQSISDKADGQMRLLSGKHTEDQVAAAAKEIDTLTTDYEQLQAQIRQTSPRYAALTQPAPLSLKEIQKDVLDDETLLLEYALGEEKSFLWAVTPASIQSFELPKRAEVEAAARRVYETLTARNQTLASETPEQRRKRIEQADVEYPKISAALSRLLLGPVAAELKGKRLIIVGEGVLQYTAFAALPAPDPRPGMASSPLITDHEIITLPSASVLAVLRQEAAGRRTPDKTVAVFADPVFDSHDPRIRPAGKEQAIAVEEIAAAGDVKRSATESGLRDFVRLRFSRQEADQIARFASEGKKLEAVDFAANRAMATSPELGRYAIVHFATHGLINNQHPELSGVVLSLVDEQGRPQNGFLRLYDIYNLKLQADLVVLSACQTGLGKEIKGEGLVGLTRGFMYAGTPRVVASLWQIDDRAAAEFMGRFYEAMLRQGLKPAAALRAAQVSMSKDKRWQAPHYWAAFTLQGEWK